MNKSRTSHLARLWQFLGTVAITLALVALPTYTALAATTVVVTGDTAAGENQLGWLFNRDTSTSTPYEFTTDAPSIGNGSLYVLPIGSNPADKFIGEYFLLKPIAEVESISYDFLIGSGGDVSDANEFYLNVYANFGESDDLKFYDCRYNIVPSVGSTADFTTVTFDPTQDYPVTTGGASPHTCPSVPAEMDTLSLGSTIRVFALNVGDTSASDQGLDGYLDNVAVDLVSNDGDGITTFDFEPSVDECKNGGWQNLKKPDGSSFKNQGDCIQYVNTGK